MVKRNPNFSKLKPTYLFLEIQQRRKHFLTKHPEAKLISLGIGDTTEPIPPSITASLVHGAEKLGTRSGYTGYGPEQGINDLREKIAHVIYNDLITANEVFISDGAKCDIGRLQTLFGPSSSIAVQDPAYPVYVEGSILNGVKSIHYMPCNPANNFFPDLSQVCLTDLIYFCSPNNPTGAVATKDQLIRLVEFAKANKSIIIFDSAYASYIQNEGYPRSIYEIPGAEEVAIEISSFSKLAGFTGIRLGWTIVPEALKFEDGSSVRADWNRLTSTIFNGASNIAQYGGIGVLNEAGQNEIKTLTNFYKENARLIKQTLQDLNYEVYGGDNAPYVWIRFENRKSWDVFQEFLEKFHIITTPGSGFGPEGEGFIRISGFNSRANIDEALSRISRI